MYDILRNNYKMTNQHLIFIEIDPRGAQVSRSWLYEFIF